MVKNHKIIVLVGPSGSGKTSMGGKLSERGYKKLVTTTTRKPRPGEVDGVDYYFRNQSDLNEDDFIEQTHYNQELYGLTKAEVDESLRDNQIVHVSLDRNGAKVLKDQWPEKTVVVFITVSREDMANRMRLRGDKEHIIQERLNHCEETRELTPPEQTDYVVENHDIDQALEVLIDIINEIK